MDTLNSVVMQLDNMNNSMKTLEQRIDQVENRANLKWINMYMRIWISVIKKKFNI